MSAIYKRGNAVVRGNLTPMIDMIFLLIVFFVLVSRIVDRERVEMNLPQPKDAAAQKMGEESRVVVNVMPGIDGGIDGYRVGGTSFAADARGVIAMTAHLARLYQLNPAIQVNIRADRSTQYEHVEPVMHAVSLAARSAGSETPGRVNLMVIQER